MESKQEEVIKELENEIARNDLTDSEWLDCVEVRVLQDALALLKAQEPVKPTLDVRHGKSMWRCGSCSTALQPNNMNAKFCFNCGQAVKWDG